jgi:hypothetical protein
MDILNAIINAQNGKAVQQIGSEVGLGPDQTKAALAALMPALAAGMQKNIQGQGGLDSLMAALSKGNHQQYLDNPSSLGNAAAVLDGNGILGHLLGSKDVSRAVAGKAAAQTGLSAEILKKLLPLAATAMMGAFAKQQATPAASASSGGGIMSMLGPLLDRDRDGSIVDDVTSMLGKFMR